MNCNLIIRYSFFFKVCCIKIIEINKNYSMFLQLNQLSSLQTGVNNV